MNKVLELEEVSRTFSSGVFRTHTVRAVDRVSFALERGKTFGLVGNSGCGKTTLSRMITRVLKPSGGRIRFEGEDIARLDRKGSRAYHRRVQIIFQNPEAWGRWACPTTCSPATPTRSAGARASGW